MLRSGDEPRALISLVTRAIQLTYWPGRVASTGARESRKSAT